MAFDVSADAYGRFMGCYADPLAAQFVALTGAHPGQHALDVGCGPGSLTAVLVELLGAASVSAVDPSEPFVAAIRTRFEGDVDVHRASAEKLPFADDTFDLALAQLVVHFMAEPVAGLSEMARVTRPGGLVAASVWDHGGGCGPLSVFWRAVLELDPQAHDESGLAGAREGHLTELFTTAGLREVQSSALTVRVPFATVDDWWEPFTLGVGPAGDYVARLDDEQRADLRVRCAKLLPPAPFEIEALAWTALGRT
ncbi:MAG: SAM-dependent methyltransferase [Pseudonocardiales bacterium]|nr:MAG: SAM-dependent methyltransferase [Pseudonocardiales bacterium]